MSTPAPAPAETITITLQPLVHRTGAPRSLLTEKLVTLKPGETLHYRGPLKLSALKARVRYVRCQFDKSLITARTSGGIDVHHPKPTAA